MSKVILAFSGGLDTSFCIPYLEKRGHTVVTVTVNTGGFSSQQLLAIKKRAEALGAKKHVTIDAQDELYNNFASYIIKANYQKGGVYPACVGPERAVIATAVAHIARLEKAHFVAHGSTGAGNDQVRFDCAFRALLPDCGIIVPIREESLSRAQEVNMLKSWGFSADASAKSYSVNVGLLGTTVGGKETHDTRKELPDKAFPHVVPLHKTPAKPVTIALQFTKGLPVALNGKKMRGPAIIRALNAMGAAHGIGKDYHIGTTIIGTKGRIGFEAPAMKILIKAHGELEKIVLTSKQIFWKNILGTLYGDMIHDGLSFEPLVRNIEAFLDAASMETSGVVRVRLHRGTLTIESMESPSSLMNKALGTYGEATGGWTGADAAAFCKLYGLESSNAFITHHSS